MPSLEDLRTQRRDVLASLDAELIGLPRRMHGLRQEIDALKDLLKQTLLMAETLDCRVTDLESDLSDAEYDGWRVERELSRTQRELGKLSERLDLLGDDLEGAARGYPHPHTLEGSLQALGIPSYRAAELVRLLEGRACVAAA